jgi:hypothetical protein
MIKYLKYKEKDIPVRVSYYALKRVKEKKGKSLVNTGEDDFEAQELLLLYSLKKGCEEEGIEFKYTFVPNKEDSEDTGMRVEIKFMDFDTTIEDIMDDVFFDFVKIVPDFFPKDKEDEDVKK